MNPDTGQLARIREQLEADEAGGGPLQREEVKKDIKGTKIVVTKTPWHPGDLTYQLEKGGWPTLTREERKQRLKQWRSTSRKNRK